MAKGVKTGGRDWVKGAGGPGRPRIPSEIKAASSLTIAEARAKLNEFLAVPIPELELIMKDPTRPAIDLWVCRIVLLGIKEGDERRLDFMLSRLIGPIPKEPVNPININLNLDSMPKERVIEIGKEAIKYLEESEDE